MNTEQLQNAILDQFVPGRDSIHGPSHWQRVEAFGLRLAEETDANVQVIRLFALFHDACRLNDGADRDHGPRGAELASKWREKHFSLPDEAFDQLTYACRWHTTRRLCDDLTTAICWDADRLDLPRIGATVNPYYLNTERARQLAGAFTDYLIGTRPADRYARNARGSPVVRIAAHLAGQPLRHPDPDRP